MKVSVFGIGYVGAVASACLAEMGHDVIAIDTDPVKIECINQGRSPIVEKGLGELIQKGVKNHRLRATPDIADAIKNSEISLICVGTPGAEDGSLDYKYIEEVCKQIGAALKNKNEFHTIVLRSTVIPGTLEDIVKPILEESSGKICGEGFGLGNNPEFLREGTAIEDYFYPTQIVVGATDEKTAALIMSLYDGIEAPRTITGARVAEGVKYVSNSWRANKISFANEVGNILKKHSVDSHAVMKILFEDRKINMGPSFLLPGFAFGGSCLPKDVRALRSSANRKGLKTPLFDAIIEANELQVKHAFDMIWDMGLQNIGLLGLSFKPNTDDLRESPLVTLADLLLEGGYNLKIYDPCVYTAKHMNGSNREYIEKAIPHISSCLVETPDELLLGSEIFVIGNGTKEFADILGRAKEETPIIDLVRLNAAIEGRKTYTGLCW